MFSQEGCSPSPCPSLLVRDELDPRPYGGRACPHPGPRAAHGSLVTARMCASEAVGLAREAGRAVPGASGPWIRGSRPLRGSPVIPRPPGQRGRELTHPPSRQPVSPAGVWVGRRGGQVHVRLGPRQKTSLPRSGTPSGEQNQRVAFRNRVWVLCSRAVAERDSS